MQYNLLVISSIKVETEEVQSERLLEQFIVKHQKVDPLPINIS